MSLSSWFLLWDDQEGGHGVLASNIPRVSDAFYEIDWRSGFLLPFQFPLTDNTGAVHYHMLDLSFQRTDFDTRIIILLFAVFIQMFADTWEIIATSTSKSSSLTTIAGCSSAAQPGHRIHQICSIFTAESLAIDTELDELVSLSHPVIILTNSLSFCMLYASVNLKSPRVVLWLHNKIQRADVHIPTMHVYWVLGHRASSLLKKLIV